MAWVVIISGIGSSCFHRFEKKGHIGPIPNYVKKMFSGSTFQSWEIFVEDFGENMWWVPNKRTGISLENEKKNPS